MSTVLTDKGVSVHRFSVDDLSRMVGAGVFHPEDRIELVDGEVYRMSPVRPQHAATVKKLARRLYELIGDTGRVERHTDPRAGRYHSVRLLEGTDMAESTQIGAVRPHCGELVSQA